ncbi:hypothetical protein NMD1_03183 [Novosphingobium sp. MD-1]|nr:hypothetical protein NMD1_03183 [Novosphingobium sp. MD-1]
MASPDTEKPGRARDRGGPSDLPPHAARPVRQRGLARIGHDADTLRANPVIAKFVAWVSGKPPDFHAPTAKRR